LARIALDNCGKMPFSNKISGSPSSKIMSIW
jgi:hypothetical protein